MGLSTVNDLLRSNVIQEFLFDSSFTVYPIGNGRFMVQSVPGELSLEETSVLTTAAKQPQGFVTVKLLMETLK